MAAALDPRAAGIKLTVSPGACDVVVHADPEMLASAVGNVLQNAFKFTRPHTEVTQQSAIFPISGASSYDVRPSFIPFKPLMTVASDPKQNHLLAALPEVDFQRWLPRLERVELPLGHVLYEAGDTLSHAYFPVNSIISLLYVMQSGESAEIAVVGNEGMVGVSLFMGGDSTPSRAVVQNAGQAFRISAHVVKEDFNNATPVLHLLLRYTQALITQMTQTAACNKHHTLHQQLCRWLLLSLDRLPGDELVMTQQLVANMLGVPLAVMFEGARYLQEAGLIDYELGRFRVLDRQGLEKRSCECYAVVKKEYDRLLPGKLAA